MAELVRTVNFAETFAALRLGESVEFSVAEFTESSVRANASRYCKGKNIKLSVSASRMRRDVLNILANQVTTQNDKYICILCLR